MRRALVLCVVLLAGCGATCVCEFQHMQVGRVSIRGDVDEFLAACADACRR